MLGCLHNFAKGKTQWEKYHLVQVEQNCIGLDVIICRLVKNLAKWKPNEKNISWSKGKKSTTHPRWINEQVTQDLDENMTFQSLDLHTLNQS